MRKFSTSTIIGEESMNDVLIVIPARMDSRRFPGKPLVDVNGLPLLWHTHHQASKIGCPVVVATSDQEIVSFCASSDMDYIRTREHWCGTARAWDAYNAHLRAGIVVNWQVDEPEIDPNAVSEMIKSVNEHWPIMTIVSDLRSFQAKQPDVTKAVVAWRSSRCHWFTRMNIPGAMAHVGIYGFTADCLHAIGQLPQSSLSELENLEQLTWLEHGCMIYAVKTEKVARGIDTQQDMEELRWRLSNHE